MKIHNFVQGSPEWSAHRAQCDNASDAPAMIGDSPYKTRSELIRERATGIAPEYDSATIARFASGHASEAAARPIAEGIIGSELFPVTGEIEIDGLRLSASSDGLDMEFIDGWEHKRWNEKLAAQVEQGIVPASHSPQLTQQVMVFGLRRVLFMVSDGTPEKCVHCWFTPTNEDKARLLAGWKQFHADVAAYQHVEVIPAVVAAPQMSLPAVSIRVDGSIALVDNLGIFGNALTAYVERINKKPETDQDFADLEATEKTLKRAEDELDAAVNSAIGQVVSIDTMKRTAEMYRNMARDNRLLVGKLVKARKDMIKAERIHSAVQILHDHILDLEDRLGGAWMPRIAGGFSEVIKGLKTLTSIDDAISVAMANAKVEANAVADLIERNHKSVEDWTLVPDFGAICQKAPEDFYALIVMRKQQRAEADAKRLEAEREKIRAEEQAKAEREAQAKARAEQAERDAVAALEKEQWEAEFKAAERARDAADALSHGFGANLTIDAREVAEEKNVQARVILDSFNQDVRKVTEMPDTGATMSLGKIAARLGFTVSADFLAQLGIKVHAHDKNAKLYLERDFPMICAALVRHIQSCAMREAA